MVVDWGLADESTGGGEIRLTGGCHLVAGGGINITPPAPLLVLTSRVQYTGNNHLHLSTMNFTNILLKHFTRRLELRSVTFLLLEILVHCAIYSINTSLVQLVPEISLFLTRIYSTISQQTGWYREEIVAAAALSPYITPSITLCNTNTWDTHPQWYY